MSRLPPALPESLLCVELFLAGGERLRQMTPCDGWRPLQGVERRLAVRASLVGGALRKSANRRVARPRVFLQRKRRVSAGLTSLSPCSLSARQNVLVQVWSGTPGASREFFWQTICIICRSTYYYYCRTIISLFCNRQKMAVSANYFWRSYWSLSLPFLQLSKITNLIMHTLLFGGTYKQVASKESLSKFAVAYDTVLIS